MPYAPARYHPCQVGSLVNRETDDGADTSCAGQITSLVKQAHLLIEETGTAQMF